MADLSNVVRMLIHQLDATRSYLLPSYCDEHEKARAVIAFAESALAAEPPAPAEHVATLHVSNFRGYENYDFQHLVDLPPGHYKLFTACTTQPPAPAPAAYAARLRQCPTHGQQPPNDWGCPECLRELRDELARLRGSTPPADGEVEELAQWLRVAAGDEGSFSYTRLNRAAALLREARPQPVPGWQPIDTAPQNGTEILASDYDVVEIVNWSWDAWETGSGWIDRNGQRLFPAWWQPLPDHPPIPQPPQGGEVEA